MKPVELKELMLPDKATAIKTARSVLEGKGPVHQENLVLLNAGAGIYAGGKASSIAEGIKTARESLKSGAALRVLERVKDYTHERKLETP